MPLYKYVANRVLTLVENVLAGHEAVRIPHRLPRLRPRVLEQLPLCADSDDFVFDNQMLAQAIRAGFGIGEISCPTRYFEEASSHQLPPQRRPTASAC